MSDDTFRDQTPAYTVQGHSSSDEFLEIARIHHKEAKQLLDRAHEAEAEERKEEAKLLMDLSISREERAEEFKKVAKGERRDPIVTEIIEGQEEVVHSYVPHTTTFISLNDLPPATVPEHMRPRPPGLIARAFARISHLGQRYAGRVLTSRRKEV